MNWENFKRIIQQLLLMSYLKRKWNFVPSTFQITIQVVRKHIILLMIWNEEGWHFLAVKLSALLRGITSKYDGDFYYLNCFHSFRTESKPKSYEKVCQNKDFCWIVMQSQEHNELKFNQYMKLDKMTYIIYADLNLQLNKWMGK